MCSEHGIAAARAAWRRTRAIDSSHDGGAKIDENSGPTWPQAARSFGGALMTRNISHWALALACVFTAANAFAQDEDAEPADTEEAAEDPEGEPAADEEEATEEATADASVEADVGGDGGGDSKFF